jgi:4-amino-4-deoxy-L-arabinose transferase-like glycosyltransferase
MQSADKLIYAGIAVLLAMRLTAIAITPLGLDVEEAQYWLWSITPDAGYFTKPPMVAWLIGLSTAIFGETSFGVRAPAPFLQAGLTLLMMRLGQDCFSPQVGRIAAVIWMFIPAAALGGFIISTDSPMLFFMLAALIMLAPLAKGEEITLFAALMAGVFTGLALMSKYAAIYLPIGLLIWWLWQGRVQHSIRFSHTALYLLGLLASILPNLIWNLNNGFATARHLGDNANLDEPQYNLLGSLEFILSQAAVVGPVVFILAILAIMDGISKPQVGFLRARFWQGRFWIALFLPAMTVITIQGFLSDTNANWAIASWPPAIILTAAMIAAATPRLQKAAIIGVSLNVLLSGAVLIGSMAGSMGVLTPPSDPLRKLRNWPQHTADLTKFAAINSAEAIITERRGITAQLLWHLRDYPIAIEIVDHDNRPSNHFEYRHPWRPIKGRLVVAVTGQISPPDLAAITWHDTIGRSSQQTSRNQARMLFFHFGIEH